MRAQPRPPLGTTLRYVWVVVSRFRWTLVILTGAVLFAAALYLVTPHAQLGGQRPSLLTALLAAWMALFAQPLLAPPETWYLSVVCGVYPLLGIVLIGEGVVRLGMLMLSREQGEKEWMKVMAQTHSNHVVLCGLGHLGYRILGQLLGAGVSVVAIEKDPGCRFLAEAKATGAPVLVRDMKEDQALVDAGVERAHVIIIATNDDMANLEVALDARRLSPGIRVIMRLFDQQIADKIKGAFLIDEAFSSAALAAPIVAAMAQDAGVLASFRIAGGDFLTMELVVEPGSLLCGRTVGELEAAHGARVLVRVPATAHSPDRTTRAPESAQTPPPPPPPADAVIAAGDRIVVHTALARMSLLTGEASGRRAGSGGGAAA